MHNSEKYPELWKQFEALKAEQAELQAQAAPLHASYEKLRALAQPIEEEMRKVARAIKAIEQPRGAEVGRQIAALARAMGSHVLVNEGPAPEEPTVTTPTSTQ